MGIDQDANGFVGWDELSHYLMQSSSLNDGNAHARPPSEYCSVPVEPDSGNTSNPIFISRCQHNQSLGTYYAASTDGCVKMWDARSLEIKGIVHYPDGSPVIDMKYCSMTNRLLILQEDQNIFSYDCGAVALRRGHKLMKAHKIVNVDDAVRAKCAGNHIPQMLKTVEFDPTKMALSQSVISTVRSKKRTIKTNIDVSYLDNYPKPHVRQCSCKMHFLGPALCAEFGRGLFSSAYHPPSALASISTMSANARSGSPIPSSSAIVGGGGSGVSGALDSSPPTPINTNTMDYVMLGSADGHVALYDFALQSHHRALNEPVCLWEPHSEHITKMLASTANPQMQGLFTSSLDRTMHVLDVEKGMSSLKITIDDSVTDPGGRGIRSFDYAPEKNVLGTIGFNRNVLVWDPLARRRVATLADHKRALVDLAFCEARNQLITMSTDKVIKIWDLRTFTCMQTLVDKERRYPEDRFSTMFFDQNQQTIVTTAHVPVLWRDAEVQAKVETGVSWSEGYEGHLNPVIAVTYNETANQVVSTDGEFVHVWSLISGECVGKWSTGSRITALTFDSAQRRILTASDAGKVEMWYYGNGRLLKEFIGCRTEVSSLVHMEVMEGSNVMNVCLAAGFSNLVYMWVDRVIASHEIVKADPIHRINIHSHSADHTHEGHGYCMSWLRPNKFVIGTSVGDVMIYMMNYLSPPQFISCMASDMFGLLRGSKSVSNRRDRRHQIRDAMPKDSKWRRLLEAAEKEQSINGAAEYTSFRVGVQRTLLVVTERVLFISDELVLTLHGDGDGILWRVLPSAKYALEVYACFPASHATATVALAASMDTYAKILYIGDSSGVLSLFDVSRAMAACAESRVSFSSTLSGTLSGKLRESGGGAVSPKTPLEVNKTKQLEGNLKGPSGRLYHNDADVFFMRSFGLPLDGINTIHHLRRAGIMICGSGDCSLCLVNTADGTILGKFGYDRASLQTWPEFSSDLDWEKSAKPPTVGRPELGRDAEDELARCADLAPHRFCSYFPGHVDPDTIERNKLVEERRKNMKKKQIADDDILEFLKTGGAPNIQTPQPNVTTSTTPSSSVKSTSTQSKTNKKDTISLDAPTVQSRRQSLDTSIPLPTATTLNSRIPNNNMSSSSGGRLRREISSSSATNSSFGSQQQPQQQQQRSISSFAMSGPDLVRKLSFTNCTDEELERLVRQLQTEVQHTESLEVRIAKMKQKVTKKKDRREPSYGDLKLKDLSEVPKSWMNVDKRRYTTDFE
eukprot:PhM_4_TR15709/c0_g1_i1/m.85094